MQAQAKEKQHQQELLDVEKKGQEHAQQASLVDKELVTVKEQLRAADEARKKAVDDHAVLIKVICSNCVGAVLYVCVR